MSDKLHVYIPDYSLQPCFSERFTEWHGHVYIANKIWQLLTIYSVNKY